MFKKLCGILLLFSGALAASLPAAADIAEMTVSNRTAGAKTDIPVTFGQPFSPGDVPDGTMLGVRRDDGSTMLPVQMDIKTRYADDSVQFAVLTFILPDLADGDSETLVIDTHDTGPGGTAIQTRDVNSGFDAVVNAGSYSASAADQLQSVSSPRTWLAGPLVSEWLYTTPLVQGGGGQHARLTAHFEVRAYETGQVRVSVAVENTDAQAIAQTVTYDATVSVGGNTVLTQNNVNHHAHSRWRRVFWFNGNPGVHIAHDADYLMQTGTVPTYESDVTINGNGLDEIWNTFTSGGGDALMEIGGGLETYMPAAAGRMEIAPLPRFAAMYLMTQDVRAKNATLGYGEQAGSWPIHYRHGDTDHISLDDAAYSNFVHDEDVDYGSNFVPDVAHQPSLAYVPYLVTGDYFFLEEVQFWANFSMVYKDSHGGADGLLVYKQIRGQAWGLRALAHAAWATPDNDAMKAYFTGKLNNNIDFYVDERLNSSHPVIGNDLGFMVREFSGGDVINQISAWQDDFLTWSLGHLVALGFNQAQPVFEWKTRFAVGRMTNPDTCWILASANWPYLFSDDHSAVDLYEQWAGDMTANERNNHVDVDSWADYHNNLVWGWRQTIRPENVNLSGDENTLLNAECNSSQMADLLNRSQNTMIGFQGESWQGYPANMQPALAAAVDAGTAEADAAWSQYTASNSYPDFTNNPQWAVAPRGEFTPIPVSPPPPDDGGDGGGGSGGGSLGCFFLALLILAGNRRRHNRRVR